MADDFNSSDIEYEPEPPPKRYNIPSVAAIIEHASSDRLTSKAAFKQLTFGGVAPGTRYQQDKWVARFSVFREHALPGVDLKKPFTGEHLIRFFDAQLDKLKRVNEHPPAAANITQALSVLLAWGNFTYEGFRLTPHESAQISAWRNKAVVNKRLFTGRHNPTVHLTFVLASEMVRAYLDHHVEKGTPSWNRVLSRALGVVLVVACASRAGDVARTNLYTGIEYATYKDFVITFDDSGEYTLFNLEATLTLRFEKSDKLNPNNNREVSFSVLKNPNHRHMCPITMVLSHASRHGLVVGGRTIDEVIEYTARSNLRRIEWLEADWPLLPAFTPISNVSICLDRPASTQHLLETTKQMGLISNILTPVKTHDLRRGAARDLAHIKSASGDARHAKDALGHGPKTALSGVTDAYVGGIETDFLAIRAEAEFRSRRAPRFGEESAFDIVEKRISRYQVVQWLEKHLPDELAATTDGHEIQLLHTRARRHIKRERHQDYLKTARPVIKTKSSSEANILANRITQRKPRASTPEVHRMLPAATAATTSPDKARPNCSLKPHQVLIDPRLLVDTDVQTNADEARGRENVLVNDGKITGSDEDPFDNVEADARDLQSLQEQVLQSSGENLSNEDVIAMQNSIMDDMDQLGDTNPLDAAMEFIRRFASINVVCCALVPDILGSAFRGPIPVDQRYELVLSRGHSLDDPTCYVFHCHTKGCTRTTITRSIMEGHELVCNEAFVAKNITPPRPFVCSHPGCGKAYKSKDELNLHAKQHGTLLSCPHADCVGSKSRFTAKMLRRHTACKHSGRWPTPCLFKPGCSPGKLFGEKAYTIHMREWHRITGKAKLPYLPPNADKFGSSFRPGPCGMDGCSEFMNSSIAHHHHLVGRHHLPMDKAEEVVLARQERKEASVLGKRKRRHEDDHDDNDDHD